MFNGRIGRLKFLGLVVVAYAVVFAGAMVAVAISSRAAGDETVGGAGILMVLAAALAGLAIALGAWARRFHDLDQSGWMALLTFVPFVSFFALLYLLFAPGTPGENRYGPQTGTAGAAGRPAPAPPYAPRPQQAYTPRQPGAARAEAPFAILAQGLDRNFRPNGSAEWIQLGSMTGREFARRASALGPPDPGGYVPNVAFDREGVRLVLYQENATVWHATDPPPGMTDRVAVHQIPEWLEAGITYATL